MTLMLKMIDLFGSIRSLFKVHRIAEDSMIFRLHYRATVAVLLAGCLTLACKSISGSPIHCEATTAVDKAVLETFCWLHTTYSVVRAFNMSIGQAVPYPGVSNTKGEGGHGHAPHPLIKQHKYYQWVIFLLLLQVRSNDLLSSFRISVDLSLYPLLYFSSLFLSFIKFYFVITLFSVVNANSQRLD
ncbi:innexin shaking-B-like [Temnothorax longispinosus]|uniref:innexin shaking-B-like n=1 Tax=Temnothorax longispinosus TaxID=300112 RepID=UPI003A993268